MTGSPRIGINLAWLVPGVVGGSEDATVAALRALHRLAAERPGGPEFVLFARPEVFDIYPDLGTDFETRPLEFDGRSRIRRVIAENTLLTRRSAGAGIDLMHHAGGVIPLGERHRSTVTIHDIQPLDMPENFSVAKRRYLAVMTARSIRSGAAVMVPSTFVKDRLCDRLGADPASVYVVPWAVPAVRQVTAAELSRVRERYRIPARFVLYPAITYEHKNHAVLLDAVAQLDVHPETALVLTGGVGPAEGRLRERIARPDLSGRVLRLGRIPRSDLEALIGAAAVVVVPSRYEGFGLPALESMSAGRPTIVADAGSLPEVVGAGALVVGPDDVDGWTKSLESVLSDSAIRDRLVADGRRVAHTFSSERTAAGMLDAFEAAMVSRRNPSKSKHSNPSSESRP